MICFALELNGKPLATAGIPGFAVLTAKVTWVKRSPRNAARLGESELDLRLGGLDSNSETDDGTHHLWVQRSLELGDRVALTVVELEKTDPPTSSRSSMTSSELEKDRARSARHYLAEYKRQRAALDRTIRRYEREVAMTAKEKPSAKRKRRPAR